MTTTRVERFTSKSPVLIKIFLCLACLVTVTVSFIPVHGMKPPNEIVAKESLPIEGVNIVRTKQGDTYFVSDDGRYIFQGRLFDVWNGEEIESAKELKRLSDRVDLDHIGVDRDRLFAFDLGQGDKEVYIFVDPFCPHCHDLVKDIRGSPKIRESYAFRVVVAPLSSERSRNRARKLAELQKRNATRALDAFVSQSDADIDIEGKDFPKLEYNLLVSRALSIQSVPYLVAPDGRIRSGRPKDLAAFLRSDQQE